ncbi:MAG: hypothetical protein ABIF82_12175 [Planctomycetota bacterium]
MDPKPFVQRVQVEGTTEAIQKLREMGGAVEDLGEGTGQAGTKGKEAAGQFSGLGGIVGNVGAQAKAMVTGFLGIHAVTSVVRELVGQLERALELQQKLAGEAVELASESKLFARQIRVGEDKGAEVLTQIRRSGGLDAGAASSLGRAADIAFGEQGGLMAGKNLETTQEIAAFAGTMGMSATETESLLGLLKTANKLGSPEQAKEAIAKISAAALASKASSIGAFVGQVQRGGTGILAAPGMGLEDVLEMAGQAREVEVSEELAAQSMISLEQVATGAEDKFTQEIDRVAKEQGLDPKKLTTAQRIAISRQIFAGVTSQEEENRVRGMLSAERGQRLLKGFRGSNVEATAGIGVGMRGATAADFEATVEQGRQEISFRAGVNTASIEYENFQTGRAQFTYSEARRVARAGVERAEAEGSEATESYMYTPEVAEERRMMELFQRRAAGLKKAGVDTSEIEEAIGGVGRLMPRYGYSDEKLREIGAAIDEADRDRRQGPVTVNVTNVNTQYQDVEAGRHSPAPVNMND